MTIKLNDAELAALTGLPYLPFVLYVAAIRTRMDYTTGYLGDRPRVSWQALREWAYIEPARGIRGGSPSKAATRRAADQLEKAGLIRYHSSIANAQLRMFLPLADRSTASLGRSKAGTKPAPLADTPVQRENTPKAGMGENTKAGTHPVSGSTNERTHNNERLYTSLLWSTSINETERSAIEKQLKQHNIDGDTAQQIADEVAGAIQLKPVSNKVGYARALITKAAAGEFTPEKAHAIERQRAAHRQHADAIATAPAPIANPIDREKGRAFMEKLKINLKGRPPA